MPYIAQGRRKELFPRTGFEFAKTPGELNFQISMLIKDYITENLNYQSINDIIGALEGAKMEFYRRVAVPYEEEKRALNGDVY